MNSHTPGPWRYQADFDEIGSYQGSTQNNFSIYAPEQPDWDPAVGEITVMSLSGARKPEILIGSVTNEANARLITVAPDLLELLKEAEALLHHVDAKNREQSINLKNRIQIILQRIDT